MSQSIIELIAAATGGEYDSLAELGVSATGRAFLGRRIADGALEVLFLPTSGQELYVFESLGGEVPASAGVCVSCGARPFAWSAACPRCGRAFAGAPNASFTLADVQAAAADAYTVLGSIGHESGGVVFFARDRHDGRLVALAAPQNTSGEYVLEAVWEERHEDAVIAAPVATPEPAVLDPPPVPPEAAYAEPAVVSVGAPASWGFGEPLNPPITGRRRWMPAVIVGVLLLVAAGAWIVWRGSGAPTVAPIAVDTVRPDTVAVVHDSAPPAATSAPAVADTSSTVADSVSGALATPTLRASPPKPPVARPDSASAPVGVRERAPMTIQIVGELPPNWSRTVNGGFSSSNRTVQLHAGPTALLRVQAPGYCADTFRVSVRPGASQQWEPKLRGQPMVGEC